VEWLVRRSFSLNDCICSSEQRLRNGQPEGRRGFQIEHEFDSRRLLDGKIPRLSALEDPDMDT